jgi:DNA-binding transcriptional LysR family regulator
MLHSRMLRYLDEVARSGSIRKAASRLNVASSAINRQIIALEQELGAKLFDRLGRQLRLTASGELLIAHVRQTLKEHDRLRVTLEDLKGLRRGQVTIATMGGLAAYVLPPVLADFRRLHPGVSVQVAVLPVNEVVAAVIAGEADLGFGFNLPQPPGLQTFSTVESRLGAAVPPTHSLARLASISLSVCAEHPLVMPRAGMTLRALLDDGFARLGITPEPVVETNSIELMKQSALLGLGVAFLNEVDVEMERRNGQIAFVPLQDRHVKPQILKVVHRAKGSLGVLPSLMAEALKSSLGEFGGALR